MKEENKCSPELCDMRLTSVEHRLDKVEEREEKKSEEISVISKAIVAIQTANEYTAKTLERIEQRLEEQKEEVKPSFWDSKAGERVVLYGMIIAVVLILVLAGSQVFDNIDNLSKIIK